MAKAKTAGKNPTIKGANVADKKAISAAKQSLKRGDQAPEAKRTPAEKSAAAEKLFDDANEASRRGLPHDISKDAHAMHVQKAALGY